MREIVSIQIGNCGNKVGQRFWELISDEHNINRCGHFYGNDYLPSQRLDVYYDRGPKSIFVPRVVACDLEPISIYHLKCSCIGRMLNPDHFVCGRSGAGNNWARGHFTDGAELMDTILDVVRYQAEKCDCLQGFQMVHSIGGGSGSGMGSLLIQKLKDEYPERIINLTSIIPSTKVSETVVEPYNAILSLNQMIPNSDESICVDNEALYNISKNTLKICQPAIDDLNHLVSMMMVGISTCFRYPGQLNTDLRKIMTNMVPYPRLHFFIPGFAPLSTRLSREYWEVSPSDLIKQIFDSKSQMAAIDMTDGRYLTCATIFRGLLSSKVIEQQLQNFQEQNSDRFINWVPNNIKTAICDIPPRGFSQSATIISNTTAIHSMFKRLMQQHQMMFNKRAFVHWYTGEGMDEQEFVDAFDGVQALIDEYNECNDQDDYEDALEDTESDSS